MIHGAAAHQCYQEIAHLQNNELLQAHLWGMIFILPLPRKGGQQRALSRIGCSKAIHFNATVRVDGHQQ